MAAGHFKGQRVGPYNPREGQTVTPLRALRLELHLTQRLAAQALGVAESTYRGLEGSMRELTDRHSYALREFKRTGRAPAGNGRPASNVPTIADTLKTAEAVRSATNWPFPITTPAADA